MLALCLPGEQLTAAVCYCSPSDASPCTGAFRTTEPSLSNYLLSREPPRLQGWREWPPSGGLQAEHLHLRSHPRRASRASLTPLLLRTPI